MDYQLFHSINEVMIKDEDQVKKDIYDLWQECFGDSDAYTDFYFKWKIKENQVFLIYYGNELAAMLHLNPYTLRVQGADLPAYYIVGVATKESHRRKGLMAKLLEAAMKEMCTQGNPFTYLMPAKESIYLPFDFRIVYEQDFWNDKLIQVKNQIEEEEDASRYERVSVAENEQFKAASLTVAKYNVLRIEPSDSKNIEKLVSFTNNLLENKYDVFVKRTPYYYERLINEMRSSDGEVLLLFADDELIGYLSYTAENYIYITEFITSQEEQDALKAFWTYLWPIYKLNVFKRKPESQITAIMTRIINLKTFVGMLKSKRPISIVLEVSDPIVKENQGRFIININENGGNIVETKESPDLLINIGDLTKLFFGKLDNEDLGKCLINPSVKEKINEINFLDGVFINDIV